MPNNFNNCMYRGSSKDVSIEISFCKLGRENHCGVIGFNCYEISMGLISLVYIQAHAPQTRSKVNPRKAMMPQMLEIKRFSTAHC